LKKETSRFIKLFLNTDIDPQGCIPTVGSMMGAMVSFLVANRNDKTKEGTLFLDPGFPVQKQQVKMLGHDYILLISIITGERNLKINWNLI
jgi:hypothetical protein